MQDSNHTKLKIQELASSQPDEIASIISQVRGALTLEVPCPSIGSTQSYRNVASDMLEASFIEETIAKFGRDVSCKEG